MRNFKLAKLVVLLLMVLLMNFSCNKESSKIYPEAVKDIAGTWKIASVTRNGVDITNNYDFSAFTIKFNGDGSYELSNLIPFVVLKNGSWQLDDPTHPLHISFTQRGASGVFTNEFNYPVVNGVRRIILTGSPGCSKNTYQYALVAVQ